MKNVSISERMAIMLTAGTGILTLLCGCASVTRTTPIAPAEINVNMNSSDYEVLATTEGKSSKTSVLFGAVQVIDGNKLRILGVRFFEDQYASRMERHWYSGVSTEDRAYYKALANAPDADSVASKAYLETDSGIPLLWKTEEVTFQGKAVKYKVHE